MTKNNIALLRGINIGGRNIIKMAELRDLLATLGLENIQTYIQSGNIVFESNEEDLATLANDITNCIQVAKGFSPTTLVLSQDSFTQIANDNPFSEQTEDPRHCHILFFTQSGQPNLSPDLSLKAESEAIQITKKACYFFSPEGAGRSKLFAKIDKLLGVETTARNWRTIKKIQALLDD